MTLQKKRLITIIILSNFTLAKQEKEMDEGWCQVSFNKIGQSMPYPYNSLYLSGVSVECGLVFKCWCFELEWKVRISILVLDLLETDAVKKQSNPLNRSNHNGAGRSISVKQKGVYCFTSVQIVLNNQTCNK